MKPPIEYHTSSADRICRICHDRMARHTFGLLFRVYASPKMRELHFHEGCLMRALDDAKAVLPEIIREHIRLQANMTEEEAQP